MNSDSEWQLDKRIPLALLVMIGLQTAGFSYFIGTLSARVDQLERVVASRDADIAKTARMESNIAGIFRSLKRIEVIVDKRQP